jgi:hypothetical protein
MYYVGMVGCPHCDYRARVCVEAAYPLPKGEFVEICCPLDASRHRISLAHMQAVEACPPELKPVPSGPCKPCEAVVQIPEPGTSTPLALPRLMVIWLCVALGAGILAALMLAYGTPRDWLDL